MLDQTYFAPSYRDEFTKTYLDNLNLLYVAFTRSEQGLVVTAPHPSVRGSKYSVAGLLYDSIIASDTLKQQWDETEGVFKTGALQKNEGAPVIHEYALSLEEYISSPWRDKLVIRESGSTFFDAAETEKREKINYGIYMHAVLSRVNYADEIESAIDHIVFDGLITENEKHGLRAQLEELFNIPEVQGWFSRDWQVKTEIPILLPEGGEKRLDRLLIRDKMAIVIDFKTGERKRDDNRQILEYIEILHSMNFTDVEGFLVYLVEKAVVEVKPGGKQKLVKKSKDKDQLSLGF
jgi:ATP-dependent exoDNAse (exonuclease V) beta subunit